MSEPEWWICSRLLGENTIELVDIGVNYHHFLSYLLFFPSFYFSGWFIIFKINLFFDHLIYVYNLFWPPHPSPSFILPPNPPSHPILPLSPHLTIMFCLCFVSHYDDVYWFISNLSVVISLMTITFFLPASVPRYYLLCWSRAPGAPSSSKTTVESSQ